MRVGDILLEHGWVDPRRLERAISEQARTGVRLCSMLVGRGAVAFDHAACALGEQHEVAAALQRHLQHRDPSLSTLLSKQLARKAIALPIGRLADGTLIVCVRDPSLALHEALAEAIGEPILLAVTPARRIEQLVTLAYPPERPPALPPARSAELQIDIEVDLGTDGSVDVEVDADAALPPIEEPNDEPFDVDIAIDPGPEATRPAVPRTVPRPVVTALPAAIGPIKPVATTSPPARGTLEATLATFADIDERDWLFDVVMTYVATRWTASLLLAIRDGAAVGERGHGAQLAEAAVRAITLPITAPSILQLAHDRRRLADEVPAEGGEVQDQLAALLGEPHDPVAVPVIHADAVAYVLLVGDPHEGDPGDAAVDLARLAEAIAEVCARIG